MSNKNYEVVELKTTTPEHTDTNTTVYGRYNEKGEFVPDGRTFKTYAESVAPPSAETMQYFNETVRPLTERQHGLEFDDKGNLTTPLSRFVHFDPEKERQRREQEQKLNEWKRKEANWYNGISVLMDIATAAGGGRVGKRTPSNAAAQAVADNERLRKEQQAEDYAVEKVKQDKLAAFYKDMSDKYKSLQGKVRQEVTDKPNQITHKTTPEVKSTRQEAVRKFANQMDGNGGNSGGNGGRGGSGNERYLGYTVMVNGQPENRDIPMNIGTYNKIRGDIKSHYAELLEGANKEQVEKYLLSKGIITKSRGKIEWNDDIIMAQGTFYMLPDELKKEIVEKTNGEIEIVSGSNGIDVIQPKGSARPFVPTPPEDDEEEELMGN